MSSFGIGDWMHNDFFLVEKDCYQKLIIITIIMAKIIGIRAQSFLCQSVKVNY